MEKFEFSELPDRRLTDSVKWIDKGDILPMWVADMDFPVCPAIREALEKKLSEGIYGYSERPASWAESYVSYYKRHYGLSFGAENLLFSQGVVPTISSAVRAYSEVGEKVGVLTPNYHVFYHSVTNNGRVLADLPLLEKDEEYFIDFEALSKAMADPLFKILILSNPHNPSGKILSKDELKKIAHLAKLHDVFVISDEIHGELSLPGHSYNPYFLASEEAKINAIACLSPTKAWNIAGLQTSAVLAYDPKVLDRMAFCLNRDELMEGNFFSYAAASAAFDKGEEWLASLRERIAKNKEIVRLFLERELPEIRLFRGEATYLLWLDARALLPYGKDFPSFLFEKTHLRLSAGEGFYPEGKEPTHGFLRMNIATSEERLLEGLRRLKEGVRLYKAL